MKTLKFFLIGLFVVISISACNKDIPKNIPDWLKTKIKEIKKELKHKPVPLSNVNDDLTIQTLEGKTIGVFTIKTGENIIFLTQVPK